MKDWKFSTKKTMVYGRIRDAQNHTIAEDVHKDDATLILAAIKLLDEAYSDLRQDALPDNKWMVKAEKALKGESE